MPVARYIRSSLKSLDSWALRIAAGIAFVLLGGLGFLPLFGGPRYEAALLAGVVLPPLAAVASSLEVRSRLHASAAALDARVLFALGVKNGICLASVSLIVALLHGLLAGFCDLSEGTWLFLLGPCAGSIMAGAWGASVSIVLALTGFEPRRRTLVVGALLGPFMGVLVSAWRFYTTPMVFAFDPFFGHFAGPLYDTIIDPIGRLTTYRAGSLMTLLGSYALAGAARVSWGKRATLKAPSFGVLVLGVAALGTSVTLWAEGEALGHRTSPKGLGEVLSRTVERGPCRVRYAPTIEKEQVLLLARDCARHVAELETFLGTKSPARIDVWLFADAGQKGRLMGAAQTHIAKPWLREIYIQPDQFPHRVLRHELAHVMAGNFGPGPFHVAGPLGGWIPDPGRIEGIAEAAAPSEDADFTATDWARAMLALGILPELDSIFRLSFLGHNSSKAYTVAGAFMSYLRAHYGARAMREWYAGSDLDVITGKSLQTLDRQFRRELAKQPVDTRLKNAAEALFSAPSIFGRRCPHAVDKAQERGQVLLNARDIKGAREAFEQVLELDENHLGARLGLGTCSLRAGDLKDAIARYEGVAGDTRLSINQRRQATEAIADVYFLSGKLDQAQKLYAELEKRVANEHVLRALEVKRWSTSRQGLPREAIQALLVGDGRTPPNWDVAGPLLGAWYATDPRLALPPYLLAKNLFNRGRYGESTEYLEKALTREFDSERVEREALRLRVLLACVKNDRAALRSALSRFRSIPDTSRPRLEGVERLAKRCALAP